jgi:hypothetical protein
MSLVAIGSREASIFTCLADGLIAPRPPFPAVRDTEALVNFDAWLAHSPRVNRIGLRVLLHLLELAPLLTGGGRRLRRLAPERRRRWLARVERLPLRASRELARGVKTLILLCYWGDADLMAQLGYDPRFVAARGLALRRAEGRP